jgi:hypothetical protein
MNETQEDMQENISQEQKNKILMDLITYYGMANVPDDKLAVIGYERVDGGRITSIDYKNKKIEERKNGFEKRMEQRPFDIIELDLENQDVLFARISPELTEKVFNILGHLENENNEEYKEWFAKTYPEGSPLQSFFNDFEKFLVGKGMHQNEAGYFVEFFLQHNMSDQYYHMSEFIDYTKLSNGATANLIELREMDDDFGYINSKGMLCSMTGEGSQLLYESLERSRSVLQDKNEIFNVFEKNLAENSGDDFGFVLEFSLDDNEKPSVALMDMIKKYSSKTTKECIFEIMKEYFSAKDWNVVADKFDESIPMEKVYDDVMKVKNSEIPGHEETILLKKKMATLSSEEKRIFSAEFKEAQEKRENILKVLQGCRDFLEVPIKSGSYISKLAKDIQKCCRKKGEGKSYASYYLDGRPNDELDHNPGEISGDCTQGRPLPFELPEAKLANVKVFDEEKRHIGNIYLLETADEERKIWHMEAIQIPSVIDWATSFPMFMEKLSLAAKAKGVDFITVNDDDLHVSNYDYIREAVTLYYEKNNYGTLAIKYPEVSRSNYAPFQGDGTAKILWKDEEKR